MRHGEIQSAAPWRPMMFASPTATPTAWYLLLMSAHVDYQCTECTLRHWRDPGLPVAPPRLMIPASPSAMAR